MEDRSISAEVARQYLQDVEPMWKAFWFHMHLVARNLGEFADGLGTITDKVFRYHVSGQKNDLARWVQEVIGDSVLAHELAAVVSKEEAAATVRARVEELRRAAAAQ